MAMQKSLEIRIAGALDKILIIYGVPEDLRKTEIEKELIYDYKNIGERIFKELVEFVNATSDELFEEV